MFTLFAIGLGIAGVLGLWNDVSNRKRWSKFQETKTKDDYQLVTEHVTTDSPVESKIHEDPGIQNKLLISHVTVFDKVINNIIYNRIIISTPDLDVMIPEKESYISWATKGHPMLTYAPTIIANKQYQLYFFSSTVFFWNRSREQIVDNTKTLENAMFSDRIYTLYGTKNNDDKFQVKYMGTDEQVMEEIKTNEFHISNVRTTFEIVALGLSGVLF